MARQGASDRKAPGKNHRDKSPAPARRSRSWFEEHQREAVDSLHRLLQDAGSSLLTWLVLGIALALPVFLLLFLQNIRQLDTGLEQAGNISLFMAADMSTGDLDATRQRLEQLSGISNVRLISPEQGLAEFQRSAGFGDALEGLEQNPLPPVFEITPASPDAETVLQLAQSLSGWDGVEFAQYDSEWLQRLFGLITLAQRLTGALTVLLFAGVVLAIGNTVRLAIDNRRAEIVVVKLVGGTDAYVARPFLYTGLWYGVGGGLVAALLVGLTYLLLAGPFSRVVALYGGGFETAGASISDLVLLLAISGGLGLAGAALSVFRHLRKIEPR